MASASHIFALALEWEIIDFLLLAFLLLQILPAVERARFAYKGALGVVGDLLYFLTHHEGV